MTKTANSSTTPRSIRGARPDAVAVADSARALQPAEAPAQMRATANLPAAGEPLPQDGNPARRGGDRALREADLAETIDRVVNVVTAKLTGGISPAALAMAYFDWLVHLVGSPGKQFELAAKAARKSARLAVYAAKSIQGVSSERCIEPLPQDHRFDHPAWQQFPYNVTYQAFLLNQQWWHNATTGIRGVSRHSEAAVSFVARQILDMLSPSNTPLLNPEILQKTVDEHGANLARGFGYFTDDLQRSRRGDRPAGADAFVVGRNVAITPGQVIYRNQLMELIQYTATTAEVQREPVLMQSAWMMKYYIMDLSPHNSLVKYLVDRGHTVFMISWLNPGPEHRDLGMEDYRKLGTMAAIDVIAELLPERKIHAVGYCLGGILLTIAAATMARDGDERLASVTLFTTMTDFTDVGEINVFMDASEVTLLEDMMWQRGYLDHKQASGGFQLLKSKDLIWSKMVREYYLGQREPMFDLMAWNADGTRMPYRQHSELLRRLYVNNELAQGKYLVDGRAIAIGDIHVPIFSVAASTDHVAPWRSVYRLHLQSDATELAFVLTSGGHNVGIVNEPGHPRRSFQMSRCAAGERSLDADTWLATTPRHEGSWWPAWHDWLVAQSTGTVAPPPVGDAAHGYPPLAAAPGTYVLQQ
jgi:polyhydroxyalkanoate synthase